MSRQTKQNSLATFLLGFLASIFTFCHLTFIHSLSVSVDRNKDTGYIIRKKFSFYALKQTSVKT